MSHALRRLLLFPNEFISVLFSVILIREKKLSYVTSNVFPMSAMSGEEVDDDGLAVLRRAGAVLDRIARSSLSPLAPPRGNGYGARSWPPATTTPSPRVPSPTPVQPTRSTTTPLPPTVSSPPRESETMAAMRIERDQALQLAINAEAAEIEALERCAAAATS